MRLHHRAAPVFHVRFNCRFPPRRELHDHSRFSICFIPQSVPKENLWGKVPPVFYGSKHTQDFRFFGRGGSNFSTVNWQMRLYVATYLFTTEVPAHLHLQEGQVKIYKIAKARQRSRQDKMAVNCKLPTQYVSERIMKIGQYLAKIWTRV